MNQDFVDFDHQLQEDDEVAFIPPVAGGENITSSTPVWIHEDTLELTPILKAITAPHLGAQVIMLGTVRDHNQGEAVTQLKYEAYIPMVEKVLAAILNDTKTEFPDVQLAAVIASLI